MTRAVCLALLAASGFFCAPILFTSQSVGNWGDVEQYAAPFRQFAQAALQRGELPHWNPFIFDGAPFLASPQSALFYAPSGIFWTLPFARALAAFVALHFFLNALGMALLLRELRRSRTAAVWGAIAWAFGHFFLARLAAGHVIHLSGYAWTPWILALCLRALRQRDASLFWPAAAAAAFALQFFSGHLQVWLYTAFCATALAAWSLARAAPGRRTGVALNAAALGALSLSLCSVQLLPTLSFLARSTRSALDAAGPDAAYHFAVSYSMPWKALVTLVLPDRWGNPMQGTFIDPEHPSEFFESFALYFGWIPLSFAIIGLWMAARRGRWWLPALAAAGTVFALGGNTPVYPWIWKALSFQRAPARFFLLTLLAMVLAAAYAWTRALRGRSAGWKAALIAATIAELLFHGGKFVWTHEAQSLRRSNAMDWLQDQQLHQTMHLHSQNWLGMPFRIFTTADVPNPNKSMLFGIPNANGYEAMVDRGVHRTFVHTQPGSAISSTGVDANAPGRNSFRLQDIRYLITTRQFAEWPERLRLDQVRIYENPLPVFPARALFGKLGAPDWRALYGAMDSAAFDPDRELVALAAAPGRETLPEKNVRCLAYSRPDVNRIRTEWQSDAPAEFWMFLSESHSSGWSAWLGRERLRPFEANGHLQAARASLATTERATAFWRFVSPGWTAGWLLSLCGALGLAAAGVVRLKKGGFAPA